MIFGEIRKPFLKKIKTQIEAIEDYQSQNRGIDAIQLERELSLLSKTISRLSGKFEELRMALYDDLPAGIPIKALYLQAELNQASFSHPQLLQLDLEKAKTFEQDLSIFSSYQKRFSGGFWDNRISFSAVQPTDFAQISHTLDGIENHRKQLPEVLKDENGKSVLKAIWSEPKFLEKIQKTQNSLTGLTNPETNFTLIFNPKEQKILAKIRQFLIGALATSQNWQLELGADLTGLRKELDTLIPLSQSFFGKLQAKFSKPKFPLVFQALGQNQIIFNTENLLIIKQECESKIQIQEEFRDLPKTPFFESRADFSTDLIEVEKLLAWKMSWGTVPKIQALLDWEKLSFSEFRAALDQIQNWSESLIPKLASYRLWVSDLQFLELMEKGLETGVSRESTELAFRFLRN